MPDRAPSNYIAVVGAGPAGFFATDALLKNPSVRVDLFERLPAPYGLVRYGVAPDHQKIKSVQAGFEKTGTQERVRYFGNVVIGRDLHTEELLSSYDQVVYAMGCEAPRRLGIDGEDLAGVHSALEAVSWYNGHPDYVSSKIQLGVTSVAVIGAGDVSMDLSRLLASTDEELAQTDMPPYALKEFAKKKIGDVHVLIRRGPAQANFALKELKAVVERPNVAIACDKRLLEETIADPTLPNAQRQKLAYLLEHVHDGEPKPVTVTFHFLRSPVAFTERAGRLGGVRVELTRLERRPDGGESAIGSGEFEHIDAGLALLAVGYRGSKTPGVPIDDKSGLIDNVDGQLRRPDGTLDPRSYVVGWLKRGPQGVIGTNKGDAKSTVARMLENLPVPSRPEPRTEALLRERGVRFISFPEWQRLDAFERKRGAAIGKPREKYTSADQALAALERGGVEPHG